MSSDMSIRLTVPGHPQQWSRASRGQNGPSFTPGNVTKQMDLFRLAWERAGSVRVPDETALELHAAFLYERPKSHYRTGRNAHLRLDSKPDHKVSAPDIDNLGKLIGDSLNGMAFDDDARFVLSSQVKLYVPRGELSRTVFVIQPVSRAWVRLVLGAVGLEDLELEGQI